MQSASFLFFFFPVSVQVIPTEHIFRYKVLHVVFFSFSFFTSIILDILYIASVPSLTWLSSEGSEDWVLGLVTRENPEPRELPLVRHSCTNKPYIVNRPFRFQFQTRQTRLTST